jgi:ferric-dicitrate binding protein FerR (iron transport regulator)
MNLAPDRREELLGLLGAIRDERLTAAEFERLETLLAEFPRARGLYLQYITLHAALEQSGEADWMMRRVRETLRDEEIVRDLQALIAADRQRGLSPGPRPSMVRYHLAAVAVVAALLFVAVLLGPLVVPQTSPTACSAEIVAVYGSVETLAASRRQQAALGTVLEPGGALKTGPNAYVRLRYPDSSIVDLNAAGELALLPGSQAKWLRLVTCTAYFEVSPQPFDAPLVVNPEQYDQVQVVGTRFQMNRDKHGKSQVFVADGSVLFGAADSAVPVKTQQTSTVLRQQQPSMPEAWDSAVIWQGLSRGLTATYYDREDLSGKSLTRIDATIDFDWGRSSPDPDIGSDKFSARWTGRIQAEHTEPYTFYVIADDGARLWIDGRKTGEFRNINWRSTDSLKINQVQLSLYLEPDVYDRSGGGTTRTVWYDDVVVATESIGLKVRRAATRD